MSRVESGNQCNTIDEPKATMCMFPAPTVDFPSLLSSEKQIFFFFFFFSAVMLICGEAEPGATSGSSKSVFMSH